MEAARPRESAWSCGCGAANPAGRGRCTACGSAPGEARATPPPAARPRPTGLVSSVASPMSRARLLPALVAGTRLAWTTYPMLYTQSASTVAADAVGGDVLQGSVTVNYYRALKKRDHLATYADLLFDVERGASVVPAMLLHTLAFVTVLGFPLLMMLPAILADYEKIDAGAALKMSAAFGRRNYGKLLLFALLQLLLPAAVVGLGLLGLVTIFHDSGRQLWGILILPYVLAMIFGTVLATVGAKNALWLAYLEDRAQVVAAARLEGLDVQAREGP